MTDGRLDGDFFAALDARLRTADRELAHRWPGDPGTPQPVHTLYLPADQVGPRVLDDQRDAALAAVEGVGPADLAAAVALDPLVVERVWPRVLHLLKHRPVQDLRIDLEDGYGRRADAEEDAHAWSAGVVLARLPDVPAGGPVRKGVRIKSLEPVTRWRGLHSLDLVLAAMREESAHGRLPRGFVVTLPKVTSVAQVQAFVSALVELESRHGLVPGAVRFEIQVETPQAVLGADGVVTVAQLLQAAEGRCSGLHYGTYDFSASLGVAAAYQSMEHPVADLATGLMQLAAAGTAARVAHGSTNVLPVGEPDEVRAAWALHARLVRRHLERGIYQGWDLHPAQLVTRYLATFAFYAEGAPAAVQRLRAYAAKASSGVLDEPATAWALAGFLWRGIDCGALDLDDVLRETGLDRRDLAELGRRGGGVARLNRLPVADLVETLGEVCVARGWIGRMLGGWPYKSTKALLAANSAAVAALDEAGLAEAMSGHPRIGERPDDAASAREQSGVGDQVRAALAEANREYEARFGHVYLVCASGRTGEELLAVLRSRLGNDAVEESRVAREELRKINGLRLQRLVEED